MSGEYGGCCSVLTLFFAKKCLTKTDNCAGAVTKGVNVQFFIHSSHSCKLYRRIPLNYTSEFQEILKLMCVCPSVQI